MKKIIGILLIIVAVYGGYVGIQKFNNSGESVEIFGAEISVQNNQSQDTSFLYIGSAVLALIGGVYLVGKK